MTISKQLTIRVTIFFQPDDNIFYFNEHFLKSEMAIIFYELNTTITQTEIRKAIM